MFSLPGRHLEEWAQCMAPNRSLDRHCAYFFRMDPRKSGWHFLKTAITMTDHLRLNWCAWIYMVIVMHHRNALTCGSGKKNVACFQQPRLLRFRFCWLPRCWVASLIVLTTHCLAAWRKRAFRIFRVVDANCRYCYSWLITSLVCVSLCHFAFLLSNDWQICWLPGELMMPLRLPPRLGRLPRMPSRY